MDFKFSLFVLLAFPDFNLLVFFSLRKSILSNDNVMLNLMCLLGPSPFNLETNFYTRTYFQHRMNLVLPVFDVILNIMLKDYMTYHYFFI